MSNEFKRLCPNGCNEYGGWSNCEYCNQNKDWLKDTSSEFENE